MVNEQRAASAAAIAEASVEAAPPATDASTPAAPAQAATSPSEAAATPAAAAATVGGGLRPLPARQAPAPREAAVPAAGQAIVPAAATTVWTDVYGPEEPRARQQLRKAIQDLRVEAFRGFFKLRLPSTNAQLRQVLYRLTISERMAAPVPSGTTRPATEQLAMEEAQRLEGISAPFKNRIVVVLIGASGTGKTSLINRMFGKTATDPFTDCTNTIKVHDGDVFGIPFRFIDTPGMSVDSEGTASNMRMLARMKRMTSRGSMVPHVYVYVDRMDVMRRDGADVGILKSFLEVIGRQAIYGTILCLTHACTQPPDLPNGPMPYEMWSMRRIQNLQGKMAETVGDRRIANPPVLVESNPMCRTNPDGEPVLPNNVSWRIQFATLLFASAQMGAGTRVPGISRRGGQPQGQEELMRMLGQGGHKVPPITYLLQNLNHSKPPQKFQEDERAIFSEPEIRALKATDNEAAREEQRKRREFIKLRQDEAKVGGEAAVAIPAPDPPLPPTFDSASNNYRLVFLNHSILVFKYMYRSIIITKNTARLLLFKSSCAKERVSTRALPPTSYWWSN